MASLHLYISRKNPCVDTLFGENHGKTNHPAAPAGVSLLQEPNVLLVFGFRVSTVPRGKGRPAKMFRLWDFKL